MASPVLEIYPIAQLGTAAAAVYTSPAGTWTQINKVTAQNTDASSQTVTIYMVPTGGSAGSTTITTNAQALSPGQTWNSPWEIGHVLNPGDSLQAKASAAAVVNFLVSGTQFTTS